MCLESKGDRLRYKKFTKQPYFKIRILTIYSRLCILHCFFLHLNVDSISCFGEKNIEKRNPPVKVLCPVFHRRKQAAEATAGGHLPWRWQRKTQHLCEARLA